MEPPDRTLQIKHRIESAGASTILAILGSRLVRSKWATIVVSSEHPDEEVDIALEFLGTWSDELKREVLYFLREDRNLRVQEVRGGIMPLQNQGSEDLAAFERYYRRRLNGDQLREEILRLRREESSDSPKLQLAEQIARERGIAVPSDDQTVS